MRSKIQGINIMSFVQLRKLALVAVAAVGLAGPASAYTVDTIPLNSDVITPGTQGYFGANLFLIGGPATITYSLYKTGWEAGAHNTFQFQTSAGVINNFDSFGNIVVNQANGLLDFLFTTNLAVTPNTVVNGSNVPRGSNIPNFFVSFFAADGVTLGAFGGGTSGVIALDDSGGGNPADADYDDLVIKFTLSNGLVAPVPEASTWAMMLLGFAGIGFLAYRRKPKAAFRFA